MSNIPSSRLKIQQESVNFKSSVSESALSTMGAEINYLDDQRDVLQAQIDALNAKKVVTPIKMFAGASVLMAGSGGGDTTTITFTAPYNLTIKELSLNFTVEIPSPLSATTAYARFVPSYSPEFRVFNDFAPVPNPAGYNGYAYMTATKKSSFGVETSGTVPFHTEHVMLEGQTVTYAAEVFSNNGTGTLGATFDFIINIQPA